jgi:hypothetical protein
MHGGDPQFFSICRTTPFYLFSMSDVVGGVVDPPLLMLSRCQRFSHVSSCFYEPARVLPRDAFPAT